MVTHVGTQPELSAIRDGGVHPPGCTVTGTSGRRRPPGWRWLLPVVVAAAAAYLTAVASGRTGGTLRIALMACGAVFTATASGLPLWQQARMSRAHADAVAAAQEARAAMRVALEDALDPFAALLLQLATARAQHKSLLQGEAIVLAITTLAQLSEPGDTAAPGSPRRLRVSFFALEPGPPCTLVPRAYAGRSGPLTVSFDQSTDAGRFLLRIAAKGWTVIDDVQQLRSPVWLDDDHHYCAFAAGPVPGPREEPLGLIVVDALEPADLAALDLPLVRLLTHLLSLALQM